ncbi:hypothetical protein G6O67_003269 [Ophiocordyceps sinensis]|uniref:Uncharacterized protein n=1 Tax=Ophiocordyceps sinensis TaxID=72228 RepID=A0A8H4V844_9HYPO|nr:hypothetical protein G6O67_003269 [Ophiocordyceps sinensis]
MKHTRTSVWTDIYPPNWPQSKSQKFFFAFTPFFRNLFIIPIINKLPHTSSPTPSILGSHDALESVMRLQVMSCEAISYDS